MVLTFRSVHELCTGAGDKERRESKREKSEKGQNCAAGFTDMLMIELIMNVSRVTNPSTTPETLGDTVK